MFIKKIPDLNGLVTTNVLNTKIKKVENKTTVASGLVEITDCKSKTLDIEENFFTTSDCNKLTKRYLM